MRREPFTIDSIAIPARYRGLNEDAVDALMASIKEIGLQTPPAVRWSNGGEDAEVVLVTGRHRLEACRRLGHDVVVCEVFDGDETAARLWEISENLHRADLSAVERSEHIDEWRRLTLAKVAQIAPPLGGKQPRDNGERKTADALGLKRDAVRRAARIAALPEETRQQARDERWSQTRLLDEAARKREPIVAPDPRNGLEAIEKQVADLMKAWNKAAPEAREEFLSRIDTPVFDRTRAGR